MTAIAMFDGKAAGEQGISAGGIDQELGLEPADLPVVVLSGRDHAAGRRKLDLRDSAALDHAGTFGGGVVPEDLIELGSPDLIRIEQALVPGLGEIQHRGVVMPGGDELDAVFGHPDPIDGLFHAEFLEQGDIHRQE